MFCFCAQSRRLARTLTARYDAALSGAGLTAAQFETMNFMAALGPSSGRALAQALALDKTTLSRNLKPLLDAKWIAAQRGEDDARNVIYATTPAGRKTLAKAMPLWQQAHAASQQMLGSQADASQRALQRLTHAFQ